MPLCPPERELELLLEEGLPEVQRGSAELHVESCAQCQATLNKLVTQHPSAVHGPLAAALADAEPAPPFSADATFLRRLAAGVRRAPAAAEPLLPEVAGYEVLEQIGRGAVGIVYRARDLELNRLVALKLIPAGPLTSPQARQRFRIESQAIARLRHPHIVQVYGVGEQDGCLYLSLELVEGGDLADAIAEGPRPPVEAAEIVADLAEAVAYAHSHGVIHRDLKPANVLFRSAAGGAGAERHGSPPLPSGELKITDFGIAKLSAEDGPSGSGITRSGEFLGTPSYTAPEQARGDARQAGPEADVYSLGAILYELLTGRPPFHGPSVVETLLQVAHHVAVPPARLVPGVPRDLDTICSKCLEKSPAKRYATAGELAADLRRFLKHEPIRARRIGAAERILRWARRRPSEAGLVAGGILVALAVLGAGLWMGLQSAAREREVTAHLQDLEQRAGLADWDGARTALERAKARLGDGGDDALQRRVEQGARDLQLVARLDAIRSNRAAITEGQEDVRENKARAEREYAQAFLEAGFGQVHDDARLVAGRMRASPVHRALIAACDDWALCSVAGDAGRAAWIQDVARQADSDPTGWLGRARDPASWKDRAALEELARTSAEAQPSVELLVALGERLGDAGGDPVPFLQQVQREHPDDFWANLVLGDVLSWHKPAESIRYYQAAMALRPEEPVVYNNLGRALAAVGNAAEAVEQLRRALRIDPRFARAHTNLGLALGLQGLRSEAVEACREAVRIAPESPAFRSNLGRALGEMERWGEAVDELEQAVELDPAFAFAHGGLCHALRVVGRLDEAIEHGEIALRLDPDEPAYHNNLGAALKAQGRLDEAIDHLQKAIELAPEQVEAHANLCDALRAQGRLDEAIDTGERALQLDPDSKGAHSHLGMALAQKGRLDEACEHFELALAADPDNPDLHNNLGIGLQAAGRLDEAIEHYQRALEINPHLARSYGALSLALAAQERWKEAREAAVRFLELSQPNEPGRGTAQRTLELCERMLAQEAPSPGDR